MNINWLIGTVTELEPGWEVISDRGYYVKYFLVHNCTARSHRIVWTDDITRKQVCVYCNKPAPDHMFGYLKLCRSTVEGYNENY